MNDTLPQRGFYRWHILDPILFEEDHARDASADRWLPQRYSLNGRTMWQVWLTGIRAEPHQAFAPLLKKEERWPR